ncbi:DUF3883 domain-containing protein [Archangium lansingense]|uniref:DUF3883 domain-containing protein n=1 Tax=Archangium lansingense TaxID=2995310 RepID=A0ABT3ZXW4_9BACT|nr:DUF3883 domain-containing protein [Archangium lansinium]MCY1074245.1 DUF3883 domain-containing protein [Archangium lansinium]
MIPWDALFGTGAPAPTEARRSGRLAPLSSEALRRQLLAAEETGQRGEELFGAWLASMGHEEGDFTWISETHARSAYDYEVHSARWLDGTPKVFIDVKTTRGPFDRQIHLSISELRFAAETGSYRIARLYKIDGETPKLRILSGVQPVAARILERLEALPEGVTVVSLQLDPGLFEVELRTTLPSRRVPGGHEKKQGGNTGHVWSASLPARVLQLMRMGASTSRPGWAPRSCPPGAP